MKTRAYTAHRLAFAFVAVWLSRLLGASALTPLTSADKRALASVLIVLKITRDQRLYRLVFNGANDRFQSEIDGFDPGKQGQRAAVNH